jgi:hypothetical protein
MEEQRGGASTGGGVAATAAVTAAVLIGWVGVTPGTKVNPTPAGTIVASGNGTFSLSQNLPTGPVSSSNPQGCGANVTEILSLKGVGESLEFYATVNASGALVHYWITGTTGIVGPYANGRLIPSAPVNDSVHSVYNTQSFEFVFQGCSRLSEVPFGFWGGYHTFGLIVGP